MKRKIPPDESKDNPISMLSKLPTDLINRSINDFQSSSEIAYLSQTNHFFDHTLEKRLKKKKEERKKEFYEAISTQNLFKTGDSIGEKVIDFLKLIEKFRNKKYSPDAKDSSRRIECVNLILAHASDLDKKNNNVHQSEDTDELGFYYPWLCILQLQPGRDCLFLRDIILSLKDLEYLTETYHRYYPNLNVESGLNRKGYYISFDLNNFLKDVLPVILGLSPKPALLPACSDSIKQKL